MTETPAATTSPIVTPTADDKKPRTEARAAKQDKPVVADPEAPYGWMTDPKTGERRPKKRPGRQKPGGTTTEAPRDRATNRTRKTKPTVTRKSQGEYAKPVGDLLEATWMVLAAAPELPAKKVLGVDLATITTRLHAQASIIKDESGGLVNGITAMAAHNDTVAKAVDKLSEESGPAWILPAMFALLPFIAQTAAMWKAPVAGDVTVLAKKTESEWKTFMDSMLHKTPAEPPAETAPRADIVIRAENSGNAA